jgi:hypothetical protein
MDSELGPELGPNIESFKQEEKSNEVQRPMETVKKREILLFRTVNEDLMANVFLKKGNILFEM